MPLASDFLCEWWPQRSPIFSCSSQKSNQKPVNPSIPHSTPKLPAGCLPHRRSGAEPPGAFLLMRVLWRICSAHRLRCFHWRTWVMLWTNNKMFLWMALLSKSCFSVLVSILMTITFLRNWQVTGYLAQWVTLYFNEKKPTLESDDGGLKGWKEPKWGSTMWSLKQS